MPMLASAECVLSAIVRRDGLIEILNVRAVWVGLMRTQLRLKK
jgi:hypothetical protein